MTFPNLPVATLRVARITQRDSHQWSNVANRGETFCSWWSTCHRWGWQYGLSRPYRTSTAGSLREPGTERTQDRSTGPGGEAVNMSARTPEAEPRRHPAEGPPMC